MDKKFLIEFAFKNLVSHKLRTFLTLFGMTIGISAIVVLVSFAFGVERLVTKEVTGGDAFRLIDVGNGNSKIVQLNGEVLETIRGFANSERVEAAYNVAAKVKDGEKTSDVALHGASPQYLNWVGIRPKYGKVYGDSPDSIVINDTLAKFLGDNTESVIGKMVNFQIIIPEDLSANGNKEIINEQIFAVSGMVQNGNSPQAYIHNMFFDEYKLKMFSQVKVQISDKTKVEELRKHIESLGLKTQYVGDTVAQIEQIFGVFKIILGGFGLIALIVASLGMFNTLTISLLERMKEVALLKILGTKRKNVSQLFLTESLIFGAIGGILGIGIGVLLSSVLNALLNFYASRNGGESVNVFYMPYWFLLLILGFSLGIGFITGIYPAKRASMVSSLDVIRYE